MNLSVKGRFLGKVPSYRVIDQIQTEILRSVLESRDRVGELLLFEIGRPTITVGRREHYAAILPEGRTEYKKLKAKVEDAGAEFIETSRGGQMTFHGPGQLVAYPILDLNMLKINSLHKYVSMLHRVICSVCRSFGIDSLTPFEESGCPSQRIGVCVNGNKKISSIGFSTTRWVTSHGFSINVSTDLSWYALFPPCGSPLSEKGVTWDVASIKEQLPPGSRCPTLEEVASATILAFEKEFVCSRPK